LFICEVILCEQICLQIYTQNTLCHQKLESIFICCHKIFLLYHFNVTNFQYQHFTECTLILIDEEINENQQF